MTVFDRDVIATIDDLAVLIAAEPDPAHRLRLCTLAIDLMPQTLEAASDRAIYQLRRSLPSIEVVCEETGLPRWRVKAAIQRHIERTGDEPTNPHRQIKDYRAIL